jgi:hypothetical protein
MARLSRLGSRIHIVVGESRCTTPRRREEVLCDTVAVAANGLDDVQNDGGEQEPPGGPVSRLRLMTESKGGLHENIKKQRLWP